MTKTRLGARLSTLLVLGIVLAACDGEANGGDGGTTGRDARAPSSTSGCGAAPSIATGEWVERSTDVDGGSRTWFVRLPEGYDPATAYPVVYQFHGCSGSATREDNNVPVERESGSDAIHVRGRAVDDCWDSGGSSPDIAFFDAMVSEVEASFCADPDRRFATGYSSGAFMTHRLACARGDVLRGVATIAGGQSGRSCQGQVAALLIHDRNDETVNISASEGARDALVTANHCDDSRSAVAPSPCEAYAGCDEGVPVVWCETSGMDHARQDGFAAPAFWGFLSGL